MTPFHVRQGNEDDVAKVVDLWLKNVQNLAQTDPRFTVDAQKIEEWEIQYRSWMYGEEERVYVAEQVDRILGYMVGQVLPYPIAGIFSETQGLIIDLAIDSHVHGKGIGRALFVAMQGWFRENDIKVLEIRVPRLHPFAQAFWRSVGAQPYFEHFRYPLSD
jgi:GNAT superfamily N-acetyltransferase